MSNLNLQELKISFEGLTKSEVKKLNKTDLYCLTSYLLDCIASTTEEATNSTPVAQPNNSKPANKATNSAHPVQLVIRKAVKANKAVNSNKPNTKSINKVVVLSQQLGYTLSIEQKNYLKNSNQATINCIIATLSKHVK